jgi:sugar lactone lactonase YvrE
VQFTGAANGSVINPLQVTLDNVTFPSALSSSSFVTTGSAGTETNAQLTFGPGAVSSNFITAWAGFAGSNGDTVANNITATSLNPPACSFTYIAPELTGPAGLPQAITYGQNATAVVILTPAVGGAAYPTGTVTLTDALTGNTYSATLPGTTDTLSIPLSGLSVGTHTFTAAYYGDANYVPSTNGAAYSTAGPYLITVNSGGSLASTTTTLSGVPSSSITYGASFTATATVTGNSPTGTVQFIVNGSAYAAMALTPSTTSGTASATLSLPYSATSYSIYAVYSGDAANAGSISSASTVTVVAASTVTALSATSTTTTLGHPVSMTAMVTSSAGTPVGTVVFSYTTSTNTTAINVLTTALSNGLASASFNIPDGTDYVTATFVPGIGSYAASASAAMTFTVSLPTPIALLNTPMALPYTMTTIAGGSTAASANTTCSGTADKYGDGCQATAITINAGDDLRGITADPFGNIYFTEATANLVRRIAPNGVITNFAGKVSGTACVPTATTGCTPTLVSLSSPRGVNSDAAGNIYISGYSQPKVYKVSVTDGLMYLVAGNGTNGTPTGSNGDGGPAVAANLYQPRGTWVDSVGDVYISDTGDYKVRMVGTNGYIQTIAGTGTSGDSGDGGPATSATLGTTQSVLTDANLNLYIATSSRVRVVCVTCGTGSPLDALLATLGIASPVNGNIYTIAGGASTAYAGTYPALATNVSFSPQKMDIDANGDIYISDGGSGVTAPYSAVWMLDMHTGYIRPVAGNSSSNCSTATDGYGSGCPALQAIIGNAGNGIGVAVDSLGSVYITDQKNQLIRKVTTGLQSSATAVAATTAQPVEFHFVAGDSMASSNSLAYTSTEWNLLSSSPVCTTNGDNTTDCLLTSRFTPSAPGARSTPLTVTSAMGNIAYLGLAGSGTGAATTLDPASQASFGANLSVAGLAIDKAGNVYLSDAASKNVLRYAPSALTKGASATATTLATLTAPGAIAVDPRGFVFVADTVKGLITQISPAGSTSTLALALAAPAGLAVDSLNNLYVSDSSAKAVYQINPITGAYRKLSLGTLVAPAGLAIGPNGNLLVADPGAPAIDQYNFGTQVLSTISTSATAPSALAVDAAGNLLIADAAEILAVPSSGNSSSFTVASLAPSSLAIDGAGNLYTGSGGSVLELLRTQGYVKFAGVSAAAQTVSMLNSGNLALALSSVGQSDTADYNLAATSSTDCTLSGKLPSALAAGGVCSLTAAYTPTTFNTTTDTISFNGNQTTTGLVLTGSVSDFTITAQPATATVVPGGSATYTFTVTPSGGATTFPAAITLSVSGLPSNYTARFSPSSTIAAGAGTSTVTLTIQTVPGSAAVGQISTGAGGNLASRLAPFSLALLLLPFAGKLRKTGKRFSRRISLLLLLIAGLAAVAGVNGCGSNGSSGHAPKSYTVTVTATVGALSHTSNVTLTVE